MTIAKCFYKATVAEIDGDTTKNLVAASMLAIFLSVWSLLRPLVTPALKELVGANGFEPSTSWSRTRRASQAALRPYSYARMPHCYPSGALRLSQLYICG